MDVGSIQKVGGGGQKWARSETIGMIDNKKV